MIRSGELRHRVDVMRPAVPGDEYGEPRGIPQAIIKGWPCSIATIGGSESDGGHQTIAVATYEIRGYADPKNPIYETDYLIHGSRRYDIAFVEDVDQKGFEYKLTCGEQRTPPPKK